MEPDFPKAVSHSPIKKVYTEDNFLEKLYKNDNNHFLAGPQDFFQKMSWRYRRFSRLEYINEALSQIPVWFRVWNYEEHKEKYFDGKEVHVRTNLRGVDGVLIRSRDEVFASRKLTEYLESKGLGIEGSSIIIETAAPEFSSEFPRPSPLI